MDFKLFNLWSMNDIVVRDAGLKRYINISPVLVPDSHGRDITKQFHKSRKSIIERLMTKLFVTGHRGKKHWRSSDKFTGKKQLAYNIVRKAFQIIELKTKRNPVQVFIDAIERGSPTTGIATIEYGGVRYPKAMDLSPQRRIDLALRWMTQAAYVASAAAKTKKTIWQTLSDEIINAANGDSTSSTVKKKTDLEKQAEASR